MWSSRLPGCRKMYCSIFHSFFHSFFKISRGAGSQLSFFGSFFTSFLMVYVYKNEKKKDQKWELWAPLMWPTPDAVIIPHTVTFPPPCFNFFLVNLGSNLCSGFLQHHSIPSDPNRWKINSSEKVTAIQFGIVQSRCPFTHNFRMCRFLFEMNGTETL